MTRLRDDQMRCPSCGGIATSDSVDVGVGLYVAGNFSCSCGWELEAEGKLNVVSYDDYFPEVQMTRSIPFIQYLRPNGRKQAVSIERSAHVVTRADFIRDHGFRFEIEELMTGQVHMTISDDNGDYSSKICDNGPDVPATVDAMILNFDVPAAIKRRATLS